jgi:hypothetical protein
MGTAFQARRAIVLKTIDLAMAKIATESGTLPVQSPNSATAHPAFGISHIKASKFFSESRKKVIHRS